MKKCRRCGKKAKESWAVRVCATGRSIDYHLCTRCDVLLNAFMLVFFRYPKTRKVLKRYIRRKGL